MTLLDRIVNKFGFERIQPKKKAGVAWDDVPEASFPEPILGESPPAWKSEDYLKAAKSWVYACVSVISDEVAAIKLHLYKRTKGGAEEIFEHPLLDLLYKVNNFTTKFDHFWLTQQYLELTGEAPWLLEKHGSEITGIYLLRPDKLTVKFDKEKTVGGYLYEVSPMRKLPLEPEEVIFIKYPNPFRPLRGRGTLEAVAQTVDLDTYAEKWNLNFFYNAARPDIILSTDKGLTDQQIKRIRDQWQKKFRGVSKAFKLAILEGGLKVDRLQLSQRDMDFLNQMKFSRDKILSVFRVPKTAIGITEDVNRANAEATDYVFALRTIRPKMQRIVEQLNEFLVPFFGDDLYLDFTDPVPENLDVKLREYENSLKNGWRSINEVRELEGLPPIENGDAPMLPLALVPVGGPKKTKVLVGGLVPVGKVKKNRKVKEEYSEKVIALRARKNRKSTVDKKIKETLKEIIKMHFRKNKIMKNKIIKKNEIKKVDKNTK